MRIEKLKSPYERPQVEVFDLYFTVGLLTTMSESAIDLEGDIDNFIDGDDFC